MGANVTILAGRLTSDVEVKTLPSGKTVISNSLAVERGKDNTDFIRIKAWGKPAENLANICNKGDTILIRGHLSTYKDKNNNHQMDVTIDEWNLLRKVGDKQVKEDVEETIQTPSDIVLSNEDPYDVFGDDELLNITSDSLPF